MFRYFYCLCVVILTSKYINALLCYSCQGGYSTPCARVTSLGITEDCNGPNAQCYEAVVFYQSGAARYVERRCWMPDANSTTTNFCTNFKNPQGKLIVCKTCTTDSCNTHPYGTCGLVDNYLQNQPTDFHYVPVPNIEK